MRPPKLEPERRSRFSFRSWSGSPARNAAGIAALVLVPTRELAMQVVEQYNVLRGRQLAPAALVVGGLAEGPQLKAIRKGARIVVATPGRLEDYLDRRLIQFGALQTLVLDEADRMLDMGFLPAIRRIVAILPKDRQTMCFSATMEGSVAHLVKDYLKNPVRLAFGSTLKPSENVRLQAFEVAADGKQDMLHHLLTRESWPVPRILAHEAWCRANRPGPRPAGHQRGHDSRRPLAIATHGRSHGISTRALSGAGGDRCGGPRNSRAGHRARHQLRPAGTRGKFHSPRRAHGKSGGARRCLDAFLEGPADGAIPTRANPRHSDRKDARRFESGRKGCERKPRALEFLADDGGVKSRLVRLPGEYLQVQMES